MKCWKSDISLHPAGMRWGNQCHHCDDRPLRAPTLHLTGGAKQRLDALVPEGHAIEVHLTLTDDHPWAQAFVILYARKMEP